MILGNKIVNSDWNREKDSEPISDFVEKIGFKLNLRKRQWIPEINTEFKEKSWNR